MKIYQSKVSQASRKLADLLKAAYEVNKEIELLNQDPRHRSAKQIAELKEAVENDLDQPLKILNEIGEIKANEGYLNEKRYYVFEPEVLLIQTNNILLAIIDS